MPIRGFRKWQACRTGSWPATRIRLGINSTCRKKNSDSLFEPSVEAEFGSKMTALLDISATLSLTDDLDRTELFEWLGNDNTERVVVCLVLPFD